MVPAPAQTADDDRWQVFTETGDYIWDIRLVRLNGDSLVYRRADSVGTVRVQQIKELRLIRKTAMRIGDGGGAGAMAALMGRHRTLDSYLTALAARFGTTYLPEHLD